MDKQEQKIIKYLEQPEPDFFEGLQLYTEHPESKKYLVLNFNQFFNKEAMHEKLINELERLVKVEKYSFRKAKLNHSAGMLPYKVVEKTLTEAPEKFEYKVEFNDLPKELQEQAIEKGQLYSQMELLKKEVANVGKNNDQASVEKRLPIMEKLHKTAARIKQIHANLVRFEETGQLPAEEEEEGNVKKKAVPIAELPEFIDLDLENEFAYLQMDYYQLKNLLVKLRSSVPKQEQRAESDKPEIKRKNLEKAALGRRMIDLLGKYFLTNRE